MNPFKCGYCQFVVYGGYYFVLTLIFLGAGVYKLTYTGWIQSFRVCWKEYIPRMNRDQSELSDEFDATIQNKDTEEDEESTVKPV